MESVDIGALKALALRGVWVRIPPRALAAPASAGGHYFTTTVAFMNGWKSQWYANVPAAVIATIRAFPLSIVCVSKERSSAVAVWAAVSELVQRTRPPFFTVTLTGLYLNDLMSTVADCTAAPPPAAVPALAVLDCGDMPSSPPLGEEPHPLTRTVTSRTVAVRVRI